VLDINVHNKLIKGPQGAQRARLRTHQHQEQGVAGGDRALRPSGMMGPAMFPGANDNASGVAMMLTLAKHFASNPGRRNILFIAFAAEEIGLKGSEWCACSAPSIWAASALMINLDILGQAMMASVW
jgi:putative aminopeptidase FrvX